MVFVLFVVVFVVYMPQITITLNLLWTSCIHPKLTAYAQIHGPFHFNKTPMAPLGCKIIIHDHADERWSWAPHSTHGFYIGPAMQHYRNDWCYILTTNHTRVSNTVLFYSHCCNLPITTPIDQLTMPIQDLTTTLHDPITPLLGVGPNHTIRIINHILHPKGPTKNTVVQLPPTVTQTWLDHKPTTDKVSPLRQKRMYVNGTIIRNVLMVIIGMKAWSQDTIPKKIITKCCTTTVTPRNAHTKKSKTI